MAVLPPCGRHLRTILSFPDEVLLDVFTEVKRHRPINKALHPGFASSSADIAAVRLTCRRFAATSSHLLVHYIRLDGISFRSLDKIEAISRHPLIRKGVRIIRFETRCYVPSLAKDMRQFAKWAADRVLDLARCHRRLFEEEVDIAENEDRCDMNSQMRKREEVARLLQRLKVIFDTWSSMSVEDEQGVSLHQPGETAIYDWQHRASQMGNCVESEPSVQFLHEAHNLYRQRYEDQEELRIDNAFVARYAAAMARMPKAKCLEIQDFHHRDEDGVIHAFPGAPETKDHTGLPDMEYLLEPMSWDDMKYHRFDSPPSEVLFTLPVAVQNAGCKLESILVRMTTRAEDYFPHLRNSVHNDNFAALTYAVHELRLKSFAFIHGTSPKARTREIPVPDDLEAFKRYIAAMNSSASLERIRLAMDSGLVDRHFHSETSVAFDGLVGSTSWSKLKDIHLTNLPMRLEDLSSFKSTLESKDVKLEFLTLAGPRLINGTWAEALEVLREMDIIDKEVLEPTGAECDSLLLTPMSNGYEKIFGKISGRRNQAGTFINGELELNPMECARTCTENSI